ncbi:MAG TPA: DPP IV N-terminal domain-containing protein [Candidatus Acidoferrum sp.]|nr:DPP IV N-terminal domain-containing protein [Candidatus Acidoferrum sp.]
MKSATARKSLSSRYPCWVRWDSPTLLISSAIFVVGLSAQTPGRSENASPAAAASSDAATPASLAPITTPNYALEARFLPASVNQLVFDLSVTPHWFTLSDRFWYSYRTTDGTKYYIVDPLKKSKSFLWDNAKIAAALSTLTNFPYDSQHLPIKRLRLVDKDTRMRFEVEIRKDGVVPNEPEKKSQDDGSQQGNESEIKQNEDKQKEDKQTEQQGQRAARPGQSPEAPEEPRILSFEYDLATAKVTRLDNVEPMRKKPLWAAVSPDEKIFVFARGQNLYMMDADNYAKALKKAGDATILETQLTTDGVERFGYARRILPEQEEELKKEEKGDTNKAGIRAPAITIHWSKDSKKFAVTRDDFRKVPDFWVIHSLANPRPTLEAYPYPLPGEDIMPGSQLEILDVASKQRVVVQAKNFPEQQLRIADAPALERDREELRQEQEGMQEGSQMPVTRVSPRWLSDTSDKLYFTSINRDFRKVDVCVADTTTGASKTLIEERSNVWLSTKPLRLTGNGLELIWWSERDGWAHYYLFDSAGKLKNQITSGEYVTDQVISLDEKSRTLYFTANGRERGEDPYYTHLYRIGLDGAGLQLLSPGNFSHAFSAPDSGRYFADTYSRVDTAPKSVLLDAQGAQLLDLETTDISQLLNAGFKFPEVFKVKAEDGITDLYGVLYKPFDFDPARKYPLIEFVYPGPQTESVNKTFSPKGPNVPLSQLGFIVIEVGARGGSPQRNKWYDSYGYGNLRDYGLADKKVAAERLAAIHPYIDLARVGMWGHSGGGFMTAAALLQYPDFYKAGWSESGNHDNNVYNRDWSEKYHGVREELLKDGTEKFIYEIDKNSDLAKNLKGHLMLTTGDMDENVSMVNTMRVANALIKADKRFEIQIYPGMRHSYMPIVSYVDVARGDFFARWLLGSSDTRADIIELQNQKQATPSKKFKE